MVQKEDDIKSDDDKKRLDILKTGTLATLAANDEYDVRL